MLFNSHNQTELIVYFPAPESALYGLIYEMGMFSLMKSIIYQCDPNQALQFKPEAHSVWKDTWSSWESISNMTS